MRLYHVTPRRNAPNIFAGGILVSKALGDLPAVWLVSKSRLPWAIDHVSKRHGVHIDDVGVFRVRVRREDVRRFSCRGVWYTRYSVSATDLTGYKVYMEMLAEAVFEDEARDGSEGHVANRVDPRCPVPVIDISRR